MSLPPLPEGYRFADESPPTAGLPPLPEGFRFVDRTVDRSRPENPRGLASSGAPARSGGLSPEAYALLDTISGTESAGKYNVMYGGKHFSDYSDHPRIAFPIQSGPNRGKRSSAAGRYQFIRGTWDDQARKLGLKDFSPASQDAAAWNLARETYGPNLERDLRSGNPNALAHVGRALHGQWTSLPGGIEAGTNTSRFATAFQKNLAARQAGLKTPAPTTIASTELPPLPAGYRFAD